jgi:hypothetical protein
VATFVVVLVSVFLGALAGLIGTWSPATVSGPSLSAGVRLTASNRPSAGPRSALARRDADRLLGRVRLPRGTEQVGGEPNGDGGPLSKPSEVLGGPNLVDVHRFYVVKGSALDVYTFFLSHDASGSRRDGYSWGGSVWSVSYSWPPVEAVLDTRTVDISIAVLPHGRCAIRADAEVIWLPAKPAGDIIAAGATVLTAVLSSGSDPGEAGHAPVTTTKLRKIEAVRDYINKLGVFPGMMHCPADIGPTLTISFARTAGAVPFDVVVADASGCEQVMVRRLGHAVQPVLWGLPGLVAFVEHELGFS